MTVLWLLHAVESLFFNVKAAISGIFKCKKQ